MTDLIDRQNLLSVLTRGINHYCKTEYALIKLTLEAVKYEVALMPAVEPLKGEWDDSGKYRFADDSVAVRCTECGCSLSVDEYKDNVWNYCPVCGSDMRGRANDTIICNFSDNLC